MIAPLDQLRTLVTRLVLKFLFIPAPEITFDQHKIAACQEIYSSGFGFDKFNAGVDQNSVTAVDYLLFLKEKKQFLFHGSNDLDINILAPRIQENYRGQKITAVFASGDPLWSMFFAILDREKYIGSVRNGSYLFTSPNGLHERHYFFSINKEMEKNEPWQRGAVYVLPMSTFYPTHAGNLRFDEWASEEPVKPAEKIEVLPSEFPFFGQIAAHNEQEPMYLSWLNYRRRIKK
jgi:hypothetical protein